MYRTINSHRPLASITGLYTAIEAYAICVLIESTHHVHIIRREQQCMPNSFRRRQTRVYVQAMPSMTWIHRTENSAALQRWLSSLRSCTISGRFQCKACTYARWTSMVSWPKRPAPDQVSMVQSLQGAPKVVLCCTFEQHERTVYLQGWFAVPQTTSPECVMRSNQASVEKWCRIRTLRSSGPIRLLQRVSGWRWRTPHNRTVDRYT